MFVLLFFFATVFGLVSVGENDTWNITPFGKREYIYI